MESSSPLSQEERFYKGAREYEPPPEYREWWKEVEDCLGLSKPFEEVRWFAVPPAPEAAEKGEIWFHCNASTGVKICFGLAHHPNLIFLAESLVDEKGLVTHEAVHIIVGPAANTHHPQYFICEEQDLDAIFQISPSSTVWW